EGPEVVREGKDHMDIGRVKPLAFPGREPRRLGSTMACGATAVAARILRLDLVPTLVTLGDMPPEGRGSAHGDRAQGTMLCAREGRPIAREQGVTMLTHDIGHFQARPTHGSRSSSAGKARASR